MKVTNILYHTILS